jgi:tetratricopeptide (TPR) repeat protein/peroxiredoxin
MLRGVLSTLSQAASGLPKELALHPRYRMKRGIEGVLRKVAAGSDQFVTEKYQDKVAAILGEWSAQLLQSPQYVAVLDRVASANFSGNSLRCAELPAVGGASPVQVWRLQFPLEMNLDKEAFLKGLRRELGTFSKLVTAEFQIVQIHSEASLSPILGEAQRVTTTVRYEFVGAGNGYHREQRVGHWELRWELHPFGELRLRQWRALDEVRSRSSIRVFQDVSSHAFGRNPSYVAQLLPGTDYWRTILDGASGIDIYGHNGVSVGDVDGDGLDDLYVCQPSGLPNRLFRNRGDGTFDDITEGAGVGVLSNTACALFADIDNDGLQDLIVVCANGPLLFLNQGSGKFRLKTDAFQFASSPQGTFTGAAMADYDRDGWLDIYFCLYSYYQGADQYRYPVPYFDAENGPANFLMRNNRDGSFRDATKESGLDKNNSRFSFCCAWSDYNGDRWPDLYVVNDFGRKNLYRNNGDGTFTDVAAESGVENIGAGMSAAWLDFNKDSREDLYVADMWTAAGLRVSTQDIFQKDASPEIRKLYQRHAMGNSLFQNLGEKFEDIGKRSGTAMGRWSWSSDAWDFDHDGYADIYIANGMISGASREDLNSFFWRQVVANSPNMARPSHEYEQAWNAINELIRSDGTWSGFERNVFYLNNRDGTFSDVSGVVGVDFPEDSRTFALGDFDQDGRLEMVLKNRSSPQLRYLKNVLPSLPPSISFRLEGKKSNHDAVGARIIVETASGRQSRMLQIGSGFLAQHTKEIFFGLGSQKSPVQATVEWPSGLVQKLHDLPINHRVWIEEGLPPSRIEPFKPFSETSSGGANLARYPIEVLPDTFETWLLVPILAPGCSLPNQSGGIESLTSYRGKTVLLFFYSDLAANSERELKEFEHFHKLGQREGLQLLAINVDRTIRDDVNQTEIPGRSYSFPVLRASLDVVATYSLLYRHLFDRHRDLNVPISFLVDPAGQIVKIYQGSVPIDHVKEDSKAIPQTDVQRLAKALPFPGLSESYDFWRNYLSLGFAFFERGYFDQAKVFYQQAFNNDPQSAEALYGLGSACLQLQEMKEARSYFERTLQLHASYPGTIPDSWNNLGLLAAREGDTKLAIEDFQRALRIDPDHSIALLNLGNAYRQSKDWSSAKQVLKRAVELAPDDTEANYSLGMVFAQENDIEHAYQYLQKALELRPDDPEALNNLGILYLRTGRAAEAIRSFQESIRVAPKYDQSYLNLARVYAIQGDREKAREILRELLKQLPGHPQAEQELKEINP